ncbi:MAG: hypothetical protein WCN85_13360 [Burkholderiales bacterium]
MANRQNGKAMRKKNGFQIVAGFIALVIAWAGQAQPIVPAASQAFVDDIVLLPVECFLVMPLSGKGGQTCYRKDKVLQMQTTRARYALLGDFNVNSPYDVISKKCANTSKYDTVALTFLCENRQENWSIRFSYYFESHPAVNLLYLARIELKTCASANVDESFNAVIRKFGRPSPTQSDDERLVYQRHHLEDRMTVSHEQTPPGAARLERLNDMFSCPGNYYLKFVLEPKQFHSGRANVIARIEAEQSKGSSPKF